MVPGYVGRWSTRIGSFYSMINIYSHNECSNISNTNESLKNRQDRVDDSWGFSEPVCWENACPVWDLSLNKKIHSLGILLDPSAALGDGVFYQLQLNTTENYRLHGIYIF